MNFNCKIFFLTLVSCLLLIGCGQNVAVLGPAFSIVKTKGIQQAALSETINQGFKKQTGKSITGYVSKAPNQEAKLPECKTSHSNSLHEIFFYTVEDIDCEKTK